MINIYIQRVRQHSDKIASLTKEKSSLFSKSASLQKAINAAADAASRTRSDSTRRSKVSEFERKSKDLASVNTKIAQVETKIAAEQKKLNGARESLTKEEQKLSKKQRQDAERLARQTSHDLSNISSKLLEHDVLHEATMTEIERIKALPENITVLFLAANPLDQQQLRLDEEVRSVTDTIRKSKHRDAVKLESRWAIRPPDVLQALNELRPAIVHFSGHGSDQDEIVFQDDQGQAKFVSKEAIVQMMLACSGTIRLVFFNTCYSRNQAESVVQHVEAAIGMNTSIGDDAARVFASQFYSAIGFGLSLKQAFEQAKALLMMEGIDEEDTPELFVADGLTPDQITLVRPPDEILANRA